jgi:tRNA(adenine34) deaminase
MPTRQSDNREFIREPKMTTTNIESNAVDNSETHERFMLMALEEAKLSAERGEVPVGCVIVHNGIVIAKTGNTIEELQDSTAHAELIAIQTAAKVLGSRRLLDTTMYVTLEPCPMCSGAIVNARIPTLVYGASDPKSGASGTLYSITNDSRLNHQAEVISGVLKEQSSELLKSFFAELRRAKKSECQ